MKKSFRSVYRSAVRKVPVPYRNGESYQIKVWCEEINRRLSARWLKPAAALICYLVLSISFFLRLIPQHLNTSFIGWYTDESFFIWCLKWWPYAAAHHLNPFLPKLVFAPDGFNLAWATCIPFLAWLALPLTATLGPIAAYNVLCVLMPALDAWTAFILCRQMGARLWPSLVGGWIFGFSPFVVGHMLGGHLSLFSVFLLPLVILVVLLRLEQRVSASTFALSLCALLVGEFLTSAETFATMTVMGAIMLVAGCLFARGHLRGQVQALFAPILFAYLSAVALLSPYLYYVFIGFRSVPYYSAEEYSANLLNLVVPTQITSLWYAASTFQRLSSSFGTRISERGAYLGLPLLIVAAWFFIEHRHSIMSRTCATMLVTTILFSMGPFAHIGQVKSWWLPWQLFSHIPLIDQALPIRVSIYAVLILAVLAALWLSSAHLSLWIRAGVAVLIVASMFPNVSRTFWRSRVVQIPTFFSDKNLYLICTRVRP